jgi:hypothetical protein
MPWGEQSTSIALVRLNFNQWTVDAGEVKIAIIGDFSEYSSQSRPDFRYESTQGRDIFFVPTEIQAVDKLAR